MKRLLFYYFILSCILMNKIDEMQIERGVLDRIEGDKAVILLEERKDEWILPYRKEWEVGMIFYVDVDNNKIGINEKRTTQQTTNIRELLHHLRNQKLNRGE